MPALDFDTLFRSVPKGDIQPAYYFYGDQDILKDEAIRLLLDHGLDPATRDFNLDRRRAADLTPDEFQSLTLTPPMMAARRILVVSEVESLQQKRTRAQQVRAALLLYLGRPVAETTLILVQSGEEKADAELARRTAAVEFRALQPHRVRKWIRHHAAEQELELDDEATAHLFDVVGDDLAQLAAELAKLKSAVGSRVATAADVADLVGVRRGETVHEFTDAVTARRFTDAAGMVQHLLNAPGQSGVTLVMALGTALTSVAYARALQEKGGRGAAYELKQAFFAARPFGVRDYEERSARWSTDAAGWTAAGLDVAMAALLRADKRLKATTAAGEAEILTEALLGMAAEVA
ncbi:MAG: DNA polymerase III subunit delta [Gemmatimonadetes bacterium GWC2_71_10]|nr:MAG: DNA polymerase III subunit delta [Gemmatimonadetes bacterium GWC2_71_10]